MGVSCIFCRGGDKFCTQNSGDFEIGYVGVAVEVVAVIVALVFRSSLKSVILANHPHYTTAQLHTAEAPEPSLSSSAE